MWNDIPAEAPVSLEGDGSGAKVSSELQAHTAPHMETKLRAFLCPTDVDCLECPRDKSLLLQTEGGHSNLGKT